MKSVLLDFRTGSLSVATVPPPALKPEGVLVQTQASAISVGTERAVIELARMSPIGKARARPDLFRKVLNRARQDGLINTAKIVRNLISMPLPLGYSSAGEVRAVGSRVSDLSVGDRVACAGLGFANHAELVFVPRNLTVRIPDAVTFEDAAFTTLGAIALHGIRQADLTLGETVVVVGLGLVGLLTVQILLAQGCRVFGVDLDPTKVERALGLGMQTGLASDDHGEIRAAVLPFSRERGADAVLLTTGGKSSRPVELAAEIARDRARVVAVGDTVLQVPRRAYFEKEIDLRLSRSYGPGRYDPEYELRGHDYPIGYVRWTENRNMEAFLDLVASQRLSLTELITHRFDFDQAEQAYALLKDGASQAPIGVLLSYDGDKAQEATVSLRSPRPRAEGGVRLGVIGAGQFAQGILLPALRACSGVTVTAVATGGGLTAAAVAKKYGAAFCTADHEEILASDDVNAVIIATRHDLHAGLVARALRAGKHVFVEKPLAVDEAGLQEVLNALEDVSAEGTDPPVLMVGFNRRFADFAGEVRTRFAGAPLGMIARINAGTLGGDHWTQGPEGGGRIVGEVCHFIDLMSYLCDSLPRLVQAVGVPGEGGIVDPDTVSAQLSFANGSVGTVVYASNGDDRFGKERIEVFGNGVAVIDGWRRLEVFRGGKRSKKTGRTGADKGYVGETKAFVDAIASGAWPIPLDSLVATTRSTFAIQAALRSGTVETVGSASAADGDGTETVAPGVGTAP